MGISRKDPDGKPTYKRRCKECNHVVEGERLSLILEGCRAHSMRDKHAGWIREDRERDPLEGIATEQMTALGVVNNRSEPRDADKPYLRSVK